MNDATIRGFVDEMEKIAFMRNLGTRIVSSAKPAAKFVNQSWNSSSGWMGAGKEIVPASLHNAGTGRLGRAYENVASLGGLTKHLPVGQKSLTVGFGALGVKDALKKEDESGLGRSRAERMGKAVGGTVAGIAGMGMGTSARGMIGGMAAGVGGDYLGGRLGRAIKGRKKATAPTESGISNAPTSAAGAGT